MKARELISAVFLSAFCFSVTPALVHAKDFEKSELQAFGQAKLSIVEVIATAGKQGGTVMGAGFKNKEGKLAYEVTAYQNKAVWKGFIDAQSGELIGKGETKPEAELDDEDKAELAALSKVAVTLTQAVEFAEKRHGGKAIKAELEERKGRVIYEITLVKDGSARETEVDIRTGDVLK